MGTDASFIKLASPILSYYMYCSRKEKVIIKTRFEDHDMCILNNDYATTCSIYIYRKRGSSTILLTATGVQDHEDVLYIYAMYSLYHSIYTTTGCRGNRQPDLINSDFRNATAVDNQEWPFF